MTVVEDIGKGSNLSPLRLYSCVDMDGVIKITNGEANEKEAVSYKCVQCGAPLTFLPGDDKVTCEYCGKKYTVQEIETLYGNPSDKPGTEEKEKKAAEGKAGAAQEKEKGHRIPKRENRQNGMPGWLIMHGAKKIRNNSVRLCARPAVPSL